MPAAIPASALFPDESVRHFLLVWLAMQLMLGHPLATQNSQIQKQQEPFLPLKWSVVGWCALTRLHLLNAGVGISAIKPAGIVQITWNFLEDRFIILECYR